MRQRKIHVVAVLAALAVAALAGCGAHDGATPAPAGMKSAPLSAAQAHAIDQKYQTRVRQNAQGQ